MGFLKYHIYLKLRWQCSFPSTTKTPTVTWHLPARWENNPKQWLFVFIIALPIQKMMEISRSIMSHSCIVSCQFETNTHCTRSSNIGNITARQAVSQSHLSCYDTSMFINMFTKVHISQSLNSNPSCPWFPSGQTPLSKAISTLLYSQLVSSSLLLLQTVTHPSQLCPPIFFFVFILILCCGNFPPGNFLGYILLSFAVISAHPSVLILIWSTILGSLWRL